jgi:uncharacterized membrane protein YcaP (DUF421 family)
MDIEWQELFVFSMPWAEIIVRGTAIYWFLFLIFRFIIRRDVGSVGIADVLILVMVADASQNAMAGDSKSIADGMLLIATLIFWNVLLDWLSYRNPAFRRLVQPRPLRLVKDGRMIKRNMKKEYITEEEVMQALREEGIDALDQVKAVYLESDGEFSVVKND